MGDQDQQKSEENAALDDSGKPDLEVTVCAILLTMAHVDYDFDPAEQETISTVLRSNFGLDEAQIEELLLRGDAERKRYADLWPFTEAINRAYSTQEKYGLLVMLWQVIFADKRLDAYEELLMRKLQPMLAVDHAMVMKARSEAKEMSPMGEN